MCLFLEAEGAASDDPDTRVGQSTKQESIVETRDAAKTTTHLDTTFHSKRDVLLFKLIVLLFLLLLYRAHHGNAKVARSKKFWNHTCLIDPLADTFVMCQDQVKKIKDSLPFCLSRGHHKYFGKLKEVSVALDFSPAIEDILRVDQRLLSGLGRTAYWTDLLSPVTPYVCLA